MRHLRLLLALPLLALLAGCSNDPAATPPNATQNAPGANSPTQGTPAKTPGNSSSAGSLKVARLTPESAKAHALG